MAAEARFNRVVIATGTATLVAENSDLAELLVRADSGLGELDAVDERRLNAFNYRILINMQWSFLELLDEQLPIENWWIAAAQPYRRAVWARTKNRYDPDFVRFMEENVTPK